MNRTRSTYLILLLAIAGVVWCSSCDVFDFNSYNIQNNSDTSIEVTVYRKVHSSVTDSVFVIARDETKEVHRVGNRLHKHYKKKPHDIIIEFDSVIVTKRGVRSNKDFLSNDSWTFTPNEGKYKTEVNSTDF
jgi:hypothetical protein